MVHYSARNPFPDGWMWQDLGTYYGAGTSGLCWRENTFDIKLNTGKIGESISISHTVPAMPYLTFKSELTNGAEHTGDNAYPYLPAANSNLMYLRGTYAVDQTKKSVGAALPDPGFDAAWRLTDTLNKLRITVTGKPESDITLTVKAQTIPQITSNLITITSPTLDKINYWLNQKSINLFAEQLLKTIAWRSGKAVTTTNGIEVLKAFWAAKGIDPNTINIFDGSGLSPQDRVTTNTMANILASAKTKSWFTAFYDSLPVYNDLKMKSGSINSVLNYAGYQTYNGQSLCFAIMVNNYSGSTKAIKEKIFRVLDEMK